MRASRRCVEDRLVRGRDRELVLWRSLQGVSLAEGGVRCWASSRMSCAKVDSLRDYVDVFSKERVASDTNVDRGGVRCPR